MSVKAFDYLDGTDASQFSGKDGWKVLLKVLEHLDEKPIVKVGTEMEVFFTCESLKENETYGDLAVRLDQAVQKCADCNLL